jgi:hypothetical protein
MATNLRIYEAADSSVNSEIPGSLESFDARHQPKINAKENRMRRIVITSKVATAKMMLDKTHSNSFSSKTPALYLIETQSQVARRSGRDENRCEASATSKAWRMSVSTSSSLFTGVANTYGPRLRTVRLYAVNFRLDD